MKWSEIIVIERMSFYHRCWMTKNKLNQKCKHCTRKEATRIRQFKEILKLYRKAMCLKDKNKRLFIELVFQLRS